MPGSRAPIIRRRRRNASFRSTGVLWFPRRERNNAVDFHIMQRFQRFTGKATILPTAQLIEREKEVYVLNERSRARLDNLRSRYRLHETVVASSPSCALVGVTDARPRRAVSVSTSRLDGTEFSLLLRQYHRHNPPSL